MVGVKGYALFLRSRCAYAYDDRFRPRLCKNTNASARRFDSARFERNNSREIERTWLKMQRANCAPRVFTQPRPGSDIPDLADLRAFGV